MNGERITAGLYARVSTKEQDVANQLADLRRLADARGWSPVLYEEQESAVKTRPVLDRLLADARAGKVRVVVVWALDRLHRSMKATVETVLELDRLGVPVISVRDSWLDMGGPVRPLLVAIFGWVAEQERNRIIERTRAALARVEEDESTEHGRSARRLAGKKAIGRPRADPEKVRKGVALVRGGFDGQPWSLAKAARAVGVSRRTLHRAVGKTATRQ